MAVTHFGGVANSGNPTTTFTILIQSVVAGDVLFLAVTSRDSTGAVAPTVTDNDTNGNKWSLFAYSADYRATVWWKRATSATAAKTITVAGCVGSCAGVLKEFQGAPQFVPYDVVVEFNTAGNETHASFTPTAPDSMVFGAVFNYADDNAVTSLSWATLGASSQQESTSTGGSDCGVCFGHKAQVGAAAAVGALTWAQTDGTTYSITWTLGAPAAMPSLPVAYWPANENIFSTIGDFGTPPGVHNASLLSTGAWDTTTQKFGVSAIKYSGTPGTGLASLTSYNLGTVHTIGCWINGYLGGAAEGMILGGAADNEVMYVNSTLIAYSCTGAIYVTQLHGGLDGSRHIAVVRNGASVTFYKDGVKLGATQTLSSGTVDEVVTRIGGWTADSVQYWPGTIDDLRVYTAAFTDAQVAGMATATPILAVTLNVPAQTFAPTVTRVVSPPTIAAGSAVFAPTVVNGIYVLATTKSPSGAGPTYVTPNIDTTGAKLIEITMISASAVAVPAITDSKTNSWTTVAGVTVGSVRVSKVYCDPSAAGKNGTGHNFTATQASAKCILIVRAYSSTTAGKIIAFGIQGSGITDVFSATVSAGPVTPLTTGALITSALGWQDAITSLIVGGPNGQGITMIDSEGYTANNFGAAAADVVIGAPAGAQTTRWNWTTAAFYEATFSMVYNEALPATAVTGTTIAAGSAVFAPTVAPGAVTVLANFIASALQLSAVTVAMAILTPTITTAAVLTPPTVAYAVSVPTQASAATINAPSLALTVLGATVSSGATLNAPTVAMVLLAPTVATTATLTPPTLEYAVSLPTLAAASVLNPPVVSPGAVTVDAPTLSSGATLYSPTLEMGLLTPTIPTSMVLMVPSVSYAITGSSISVGSTLNAPAISPGDVTVIGVFIDSAEMINVPIITVGDVSVSGETIGTSLLLNPPSLAMALLTPTVTTTAAVFAPTLAATLTTSTLASTAVVHAPVITALSGAAAVGASTIPSTLALYGPTVAYSVIGDFQATTTLVFAPSVAMGLLAPTVPTAAVLHPPTLAYTVGMATIPAGGGVLAPSVSIPIPSTTLTAGTVSASSEVFAPSLAMGTQAATVPSTATLVGPSLAYTVIGATVGSTATVGAPRVAPEVRGLSIGATSGLFAPTVVPGPVTITGAFIPATNALFTVRVPTVTTPNVTVISDPLTVRPLCTSAALQVMTLYRAGAISCRVVMTSDTLQVRVILGGTAPHVASTVDARFLELLV